MTCWTLGFTVYFYTTTKMLNKYKNKTWAVDSANCQISCFLLKLTFFFFKPGQKQQHGWGPRPLPQRVWHCGSQWHDRGHRACSPSAHAAVWGPGGYRHREGLWQGEYWARAAPTGGCKPDWECMGWDWGWGDNDCGNAGSRVKIQVSEILFLFLNPQ